MGRMRNRLVVCASALALAAGCTSVTGDPVAGDDLGAGKTSSAVPDVPTADDDDATGDSDAEPTSAELIAAALEAGEIDEPTSLLYRTWLYFGDTQLPEQYIGAEQHYELGLLAEVRDALDSMPADIRAQVEPYLLRPEDAASAFNVAADESDPPGLRGATSGALKAGETKEPPHKCQTGWDSMPVTGLNFRVWACKDADALREGSNADVMARMAAMLQKYVPDMTADMGELIPDDPSKQPGEHADARIDVYVMPTNWLAPARGLEWLYSKLGEITGGVKPDVVPNYARTVSSPPESGVTSSSFVLVSSDHFGDMALLERMVVHELFHAFQFAHHRHLDAQWWTEGSAEWAASYYVRYDSARLHQARLPVRQNSIHSLLAPRWVEDLAPYGAYLWPLFMEQEAGAASVFDAWKAMAELPAGSGDAPVLAAIGRQLKADVPSLFPEFIMRAFNANLPGNPIKPRFVDLDRNFPDGLQAHALAGELSKKPLEIGELRVEGLGHFYADIDVPGLPPDPPDADISITITSNIDQYVTAAPTLEALVRQHDGTYERQRIHYGGDGATVCVNGNLKLVLSNTETNASDAAIGSIFLERNYDDDDLPMPCTRVEATNPETFTPLFDDEILAVDGTENDDKPDVGPIVVTVLDVPADEVSDYRVAVTLTGETLDEAKEFDWALGEFDVLAPDKVYRKTIDVTLDQDLTDKNREFTIDARLIRDAVEAHSHQPTVELHGLKPCDPDDVDVTCELVGDLAFSFDGEYQSAVNRGTTRTAHVDGTLSLRLGELQSGMLGSYDGYPDAGSTFDVTGSSTFEHYTSGDTEGGPTSVAQTFVTQLDDTANMPAIGLGNGAQALILRVGDLSILKVMVPIKQTISPTNIEMADPNLKEQFSWTIGCPVAPTESFHANAKFWTDGNADRDVFSLPQTTEDEFGTWNESGSAITFSCTETWGPEVWDSGSTGSATYRLNGTLRRVRVDE